MKLLLAALLVASPALAQTTTLELGPPTAEYIFPCSNGTGMFSCRAQGRPKTGDVNLDRALAICDAHPNPVRNVTPVYPEYDPNTVPECGKVFDKYQQTETAKRIKAEVDQEAADRAWLSQYAKDLK